MEIYVKKSFISIFVFFLFLKHDFISFVDFTRIAASNTAVMTSQIRPHRILYIDLLHALAHFVVKIYAKFSLNDGF